MLMSMVRIAFVDASVSDWHSLIDNLTGQSIEAHLIDPARDGAPQLAALLYGRTGIGMVELFTIGRSGALLLGSSWLSAGSLFDQAASTWSPLKFH
jgi:hypothetical protein